LPFSLPIINVEQKQVEEKLKLCNQNFAIIIFYFRFQLLMLSKSKLRKNQSLQLKLCNNLLPFSLPFVNVEQKQVEEK
jgi:hypothetical protein